MELIVKKLGPIDEVFLQLKPLTVICGQNMSGKSLVIDSIDTAFNREKLPEFMEKYTGSKSKGIIRVKEGSDTLKVNIGNEGSKYSFGSDQAKVHLGSDTLVLQNDVTHIPAHKTIGNLPIWFSSQFIGQKPRLFYLMEQHIGLQLSFKGPKSGGIDLLHTNVEIAAKDISDETIIIEREGIPLQPAILTLSRICHSLKTYKDRYVFLIKNPEAGLGSFYIRRYVNAILHILRECKLARKDVIFVIETMSPIVLNQIGTRIYGLYGPRTEFNQNNTLVTKLIDPKDVAVYGMVRKGGKCSVALRGSYDSQGNLIDWKTGFLS